MKSNVIKILAYCPKPWTFRILLHLKPFHHFQVTLILGRAPHSILVQVASVGDGILDDMQMSSLCRTLAHALVPRASVLVSPLQHTRMATSRCVVASVCVPGALLRLLP